MSIQAVRNDQAIRVGRDVGPYRIDALLGAGGMGIVYRAHDRARHRTVAIKVVDRRSADSASPRRLVREARVAAALNHPSICGIHEVGYVDGEPFIVMEHVEGRPLASLIPPHKGLAPDVVLHYATQICAAVAHAHQRGIVHRDLKSSNIVVAADGRAKLLDFGLAVHDEDRASELETTWPRDIPSGAGTVPYMAPELLRGRPASRRSDVWALGVLMYEMLAGRRPFRSATRYELAAKILAADPAPLPGRVPERWREVVLRSLQKDPADRYRCARAVAAALDDLR